MMSEATFSMEGFSDEAKGIIKANEDFHCGTRLLELVPGDITGYGNKLELYKSFGFNSYQRFDYNTQQKDLHLRTIRRVCNGRGISLAEFFRPASTRLEIVSQEGVRVRGKSNNVMTQTGNNNVAGDGICQERLKMLQGQVEMLKEVIKQKNEIIAILKEKN